MTRKNPTSLNTRKLLNVGCGQSRPEQLPLYFQSSQWQEIRLDLDPLVKPDINARIIDMSVIADSSIDAIWSSHNLEHLNSYDVPLALAEFKRILKPNGFSLITLPDLQALAQQIIEVLPEVVTTRESGYMAVKYEKIIPLLIEGIKAQQVEINELKELIKNKL